MPIKLKSLIKESRRDIFGLSLYLADRMLKLKAISVRDELPNSIKNFWVRSELWRKFRNSGNELAPEQEEELCNEMLDLVNRIDKEIEAIKKSK